MGSFRYITGFAPLHLRNVLYLFFPTVYVISKLGSSKSSPSSATASSLCVAPSSSLALYLPSPTFSIFHVRSTPHRTARPQRVVSNTRGVGHVPDKCVSRFVITVNFIDPSIFFSTTSSKILHTRSGLHAHVSRAQRMAMYLVQSRPRTRSGRREATGCHCRPSNRCAPPRAIVGALCAVGHARCHRGPRCVRTV
jgi:hypothetical protein